MNATKSEQTKTQIIQGLRELADFLEQHPQILINSYLLPPAISLHNFVDSAEHLSAAITDSGKWARKDTPPYLYMEQTFAEGLVKITLAAAIDKVCEKVIVGQKTEDVVEWQIKSVPAKTEEPVL